MEPNFAQSSNSSNLRYRNKGSDLKKDKVKFPRGISLDDFTSNIIIALSDGSITRDKFEIYVTRKNEKNPDRCKIAITMFDEDPITAIKWYTPDLLKSI